MKNRVLLFAGAAVVLAGFVVLFCLHSHNDPQAASKFETRGTAKVSSPEFKREKSRELDPSLNPYAGALKQPGISKRDWDPAFISRYATVPTNSPIAFQLPDGTRASGSLRIKQMRDGELTYISGDLALPGPGTFFFLRPPEGSKAGKAAGVIEFTGSDIAYRIEPTGPDGAPELWQRRLDEVRCQSMPLIDPARAGDIAEMPPLRPDLVPDYAPDYNSNIVSLQSYPGAAGVLLLDFFGGYTPTWGGVSYPPAGVNNAQIKDLWKRVAEDYMPFNINVTTDIRVYLNASASSRQKVVFTPNTSAMPSGAAGVAYVGSWNWGSDTVCWSIYTSGKAGGEVGAHEAGHTLGLGHQGTSTSGYFSGQGSGVTGWAPIMGAGYYDPVVTWAKGEYTDANNHEDELNIITTQNNNVTYRPDDTGSTLATSRFLEVYPGNTASAEGVIERTADTDAFQFTTGGGLVSLAANPVGDWADLAISATLANSSDTIIGSNNPQTSLSASVVLSVPAGTYTFRVTGAGRNNPLTDGFTSYSSLGYYSITGTVAAARLPTRLSIAEHSPNGALVGLVPANSTNNLFSYSIVSGNTGGTFSIDSHGVVRVANNLLLDYNRLATNTMLPVQFELLVNINDLTVPALNETSRRVVIALLNVNDAPQLTGFTAYVLEHTASGTPIGAVTMRDADFFETLSFSIVSGDPAGQFTIDQNGTLYVAGDLNASVQTLYSLAVAVNDNVIGNPLAATNYVNLIIVPNHTPFQPQSISYALYDNIGSGTAVSDLTSNARFPLDPDSELQMPTSEGLLNRADNYGAAMRGYLIAPQSGSYTFWIASDDSGELWLGTTTNTATATRIAYISGYTSWRQWTKFTTQQSAPISLVAGQGYYLEARMKEGGGGDHLSVAWRGPATANLTNIIPGLYLAPYHMNYVPHLAGGTVTLHQGAYTGAAIMTLGLTDVNASDSHTFTITSGNSAGLFTIDNSGTLRVADANALLAAATGPYPLQISTTDSGSPPLSASASVTVNLIGSSAITTSSLMREIWNNIGGGTAVSDLTNNPAYPGRPDQLEPITDFASAVDRADNYGSRVRAVLTPTTTGSYRFFISSDDNSALLLSTDQTPGHATRIAYVPNWTAVNTWTTYSQQISAPVTLTAGQSYYIEALQKEGGGGDHVEVAWAGPGIVDGSAQPATNIITAAFLSPVDIDYPPQFSNQALPVFNSIPNNTAVGRVAVLDSPLDTLSFQILAGNVNNMFSINPISGVISVVDNTLIANGSMTSFPLTVAAQDSGYGGLYPSHASQATVTISVQTPAGSTLVWTGAAATNTWGSAGNWGGTTPANGARLTFGFPWQQPNRNDLLTSADWVQFTNSGFNISGNTLRLQSGLTNRGDNTWNVDLTTLGAAQTWNNITGTLAISCAVSNGGYSWSLIAGGDVRLSGPVSGAGAFNKSGTARLLFSGTHPYTGQTTISSAGASTTALEVNGAEDLDIRYSDLTMNGRMDLGSHDAIVGALSGTGVIFANDLTRTVTVGANDHSGTFSGVLQNAGSIDGVTLNLVKTGAGTQTLNAANTYSGLTAVMNGVLSVVNSSALGTSAGGTIVRPGATLALANNVTITTEPLTLNGLGVGGTGALRNDSGINTFNGPITLGSATLISAPSGHLNLGGAWNTASFTSTLTFDTAFGVVISANSAIPGGLTLIKRGPGTLILNSANTYMGSTLLNEGQVYAGSTDAFSWTPSITMQAGTSLNLSSLPNGLTITAAQTLQGQGTIYGSITIKGRLSVDGAPVSDVSIGTMTVNGNATLAGTTAMDISKQSGAVSNDLLICTGTLNLGGTLSPGLNTGGAAEIVAGNSFKIFDAASYTGSFSSYILPPLTTGLAWDVSNLNRDGTIRVEPTAPPTLGTAISGNSITLSWPGVYSSYSLQGQTNSAGQGLGPVWYAVPGVTNNAISILLDSANGSAFYRLVHGN